jgi:hypothetical protein
MEHWSLTNQFGDVLGYTESGHSRLFLEYGTESNMVKPTRLFPWQFVQNRTLAGANAYLEIDLLTQTEYRQR